LRGCDLSEALAQRRIKDSLQGTVRSLEKIIGKDRWHGATTGHLLSLFVARINKGAHRYFALSGWKVNTGG